MIEVDDAIDVLQRQLDDTQGELFTRAQLLAFLQDGYDRLCREAQALFDMAMYDTQPRTANYTRDFEKDFIEGPIYAKFNCTRESDAEFMEGGAIVSNHTKPSDADYMTEDGHTPTVTGLRQLPEDYASIDRVVHDTLRLSAEHDRYNRMTRTDYQTLQGGVFQYQMDQDGWRNLRLVNVPAAINQSELYDLDFGDDSNHHGIIRAITEGDYETTDEPVIGSYGVLRSMPKHFVIGSQYGGMRQILEKTDNTFVEYFRLGKPLSESAFEIPDRMVKYVQWWALYRAYSTPGETENTKLAEHYMMRFQSGIDRLKTRIKNVMRERTIAMGSKRTNIRDNYLEHFPADYGYSRPFRR